MTSLRHGTSDTRRKNGFGIDIVIVYIMPFCFGVFFLFFLGGFGAVRACFWGNHW